MELANTPEDDCIVLRRSYDLNRLRLWGWTQGSEKKNLT